MADLKTLIALVEYWTNQPTSEQKTVVLKVYLKALAAFTKNNLVILDNDGKHFIVNTASNKDQALKVLASIFNVPFKKRGEYRSEQVYRINSLLN